LGVPAVVGDTNLFRLICCMINPQMLRLMPAMIMLTKRGSRLSNNVVQGGSMKLRYLLLLLAVLACTSIFIGVEDLSPLDIFHLNKEQAGTLFDSRLPRLVSIIRRCSGSCRR
jgi:hypothetical protein